MVGVTPEVNASRDIIHWPHVNTRTTYRDTAPPSQHTMRDPVTLFCLIYKQKTKTAFAVQIDKTETFDVLKQHIVRKNRHYFGRIDLQQLRLYKVSIKSGNENSPPHGPFNELQPTWTIGRAFPTEPPEEEIHILAKAVQSTLFFFFFLLL